MAHLTIESAAAPTVPGSTEQTLADLVAVGATCCVILAAANPGILAGALLAASWRWLDRPPEWLRVLSATLLLAPLLWLETFVVVGWPWRLWVSPDWPPALAPVNGYLAMRSFCTEMLAGPMWLEVVLLLVTLWSRGPRAQVVRERRRDQQRWRAISGERRGLLPDPSALRLEHPRPLPSSAHPPGCVRLGIDAETDQALDLQSARRTRDAPLPDRGLGKRQDDDAGSRRRRCGLQPIRRRHRRLQGWRPRRGCPRPRAAPRRALLPGGSGRAGFARVQPVLRRCRGHRQQAHRRLHLRAGGRDLQAGVSI